MQKISRPSATDDESRRRRSLQSNPREVGSEREPAERASLREGGTLDSLRTICHFPLPRSNLKSIGDVHTRTCTCVHACVHSCVRACVRVTRDNDRGTKGEGEKNGQRRTRHLPVRSRVSALTMPSSHSCHQLVSISRRREINPREHRARRTRRDARPFTGARGVAESAASETLRRESIDG